MHLLCLRIIIRARDPVTLQAVLIYNSYDFAPLMLILKLDINCLLPPVLFSMTYQFLVLYPMYGDAPYLCHVIKYL